MFALAAVPALALLLGAMAIPESPRWLAKTVSTHPWGPNEHHVGLGLRLGLRRVGVGVSVSWG